MEVTYDKRVGAAYIYLIPPEERVRGVAAKSVPFEKLILDFDADGRLIGIETIEPEEALRPSTLAEARQTD